MGMLNIIILIIPVFLLYGCIEQIPKGENNQLGIDQEIEDFNQLDYNQNTKDKLETSSNKITNIIEIEKGTDISNLPPGTEYRIRREDAKVKDGPSGDITASKGDFYYIYERPNYGYKCTADSYFNTTELVYKFDNKTYEIYPYIVNASINAINETENFKLINKSSTRGSGYLYSSIVNASSIRNFYYVNKSDSKDLGGYYNRSYIVSIFVYDGKMVAYNSSRVVYYFDENRLIYDINFKIEDPFNNNNSSRSENWSGDIIFYEGRNNHIFWKSGPFYIQVQGEFVSLYEFIVNNSFPIELVKAYLRLYPSDCSENDCGKVIDNENFDINDIEPDYKEVEKKYEHSLKCPLNTSRDRIKKILEDNNFYLEDFNDADFNDIEYECNLSGDREFYLYGKINDTEIRTCFNNLGSLIKDNYKTDNCGVDILEYNVFEIAEECLKRREFNETYQEDIKKPKNEGFFRYLTEIWNEDLLFDIDLIDVDKYFEMIKEDQKIEQECINFPAKDYTIDTFPGYCFVYSADFDRAFEWYFGYPYKNK